MLLVLLLLSLCLAPDMVHGLDTGEASMKGAAGGVPEGAAREDVTKETAVKDVLEEGCDGTTGCVDDGCGCGSYWYPYACCPGLDCSYWLDQYQTYVCCNASDPWGSDCIGDPHEEEACLEEWEVCVAETDCCPGLHCYHVPAPWDDNTYCQSELVVEEEEKVEANMAATAEEEA
jgi:hypothetical protein